MKNSDEVNPFNINLQTQSRRHDKPLTSSTTMSKTKASAEPLMTPNFSLHIPQPKIEAIPEIPKGPLCCNAASNQDAHTYSIVDDLAQSPTAMLMLEFLQSFPSQKKSLLTALGTVYPSDNHFIIFLVDTLEHPPFSSSFTFQIPV